jgi:hypothetical protein
MAVITTATIIEATNAIAMIANLTIVIKRIGATIALNVRTRTRKVSGPTTRRMIAKGNYSKKKSNKAMHNDQSSKLSTGNSSGKRR